MKKQFQQLFMLIIAVLCANMAWATDYPIFYGFETSEGFPNASSNEIKITTCQGWSASNANMCYIFNSSSNAYEGLQYLGGYTNFSLPKTNFKKDCKYTLTYYIKKSYYTSKSSAVYYNVYIGPNACEVEFPATSIKYDKLITFNQKQEKTQWELVSIDIPTNYVGDYYITFEYPNTWLYLDNITITETVNPCKSVDTATIILDTTSTPAKITWEPADSETAWNVALSINGYNSGMGGQVNAPEIELTNLAPGMINYVSISITSLCGGESTSYPTPNKTMSVQADCGIATAFPVSWQFNTDCGFSPGGNTKTEANLVNKVHCWEHVSDDWWMNYSNLAVSVNGAQLTFPPVKLKDINYEYYIGPNTSISGSFKMYASTNEVPADSDLIRVQEGGYSGGEWQDPLNTIFLPTKLANKTVYLTIEYDKSSSPYNDLHIVRFSVFEHEITCPTVDAYSIVVDNIQETTVDVVWDGESTDNWSISLPDYESGYSGISATNPQFNTQTNKWYSTIQDLNPGTLYENFKISIVRICSATDQSKALIKQLTFQTNCSKLSFDSNGQLIVNAGVPQYSSGGINLPLSCFQQSNGEWSDEGGNFMAKTSGARLTLPAIALGDDDALYEVQFGGSMPAFCNFYASEDPDPSKLTDEDLIGGQYGTFNYSQSSWYLPSSLHGDVYITIEAKSAMSGNYRISQVRVIKDSLCSCHPLDPVTIQATLLSPTSVKIDWEAGENESSYNNIALYVKNAQGNYAQIGTTVSNITTTTYTYTGLDGIEGADTVGVRIQSSCNYATQYILVPMITPPTDLTLADDEAVSSDYVGKAYNVTLGRTLRAGMYNTLTLPFGLTADQIAASDIAAATIYAYDGTEKSGNAMDVVLEEATAMTAGVPYIVDVPAGDNIVNPVFPNVTITTTSGSTVEDTNLDLIGVLAPTLMPVGKENLMVGENNSLFWSNEEANLNAFRSYFKVNNDQQAGAPCRFLVGRGGMTGLKNTKTNADVQKFIRNGQLYFRQDGKLYNAQGQMVK